MSCTSLDFSNPKNVGGVSSETQQTIIQLKDDSPPPLDEPVAPAPPSPVDIRTSTLRIGNSEASRLVGVVGTAGCSAIGILLVGAPQEPSPTDRNSRNGAIEVHIPSSEARSRSIGLDSQLKDAIIPACAGATTNPTIAKTVITRNANRRAMSMSRRRSRNRATATRHGEPARLLEVPPFRGCFLAPDGTRNVRPGGRFAS